MSRRMLFLVLSAGALSCSAAPTTAAGRDCSGYAPALRDKPVIEAGKVAGGAKTYFVKSEMDAKACPADTKACRRKAFLVPGNGVLVSGRTGDFVCATFVNSKGVETSGWLPKAAVEAAADAASAGSSWPGTWVREEAEIEIKTIESKLKIKGDATHGAQDPDRVKRGAVNSGEISAVIVPKGDRLSFAMSGNDATLPVEKGDDTTCKVWMQRVGDYLLVDDNNACGGMNVTFRGTYARR